MKSSRMRWLKQLTLLALTCLLSGPALVFAMGGYLSFVRPSGTPSQLDGLDFYFRMGTNPGPKSFMYYAHNFAISSANNSEEQLTGYIGPQSNGGNDGIRRTLVIATVWYHKEGRLLSFSGGSDSSCHTEHNGAESQNEWLIQCRVNDNSEIARTDMPNGTTYKISVTNTATNGTTMTYDFSITDLVTMKKTTLGLMTFSNVAGINATWPSHFLENFGGGYNCQTIPYMAYSEEGPVGVSRGQKYLYTVQPNTNGPFDCTSNVSFSANHAVGTVEYGIHRNDR